MSVFTEHLSQRFLTIAPDLRGYGQSKVRTPFQMQDHLTDLEMLLEQLKIQRCLVLGWSLGGILAMELAMRQPERFSGLILIATAARPRSNHPPITWQDNFYTGIASLLNWLQPGWHWNMETFGRRSLYRHLMQQHTPDSYAYLAKDALPAYLNTSRFAAQALRQALQQRYDRLANLAIIQCPALVIAGEGDRHITATSSQETADHLPDSYWICYPNTAHLLPWEIPRQMLADIDQWLGDRPDAIEFCD
jgi:proline iminopeptidase